MSSHDFFSPRMLSIKCPFEINFFLNNNMAVFQAWLNSMNAGKSGDQKPTKDLNYVQGR